MNNNKRIISTVIISILVLINLYIVFFVFCKNPLSSIFDGKIDAEKTGIIGAFFAALAVGVAYAIVLIWHIVIIILHLVCLFFTIRNCKSILKPVRIINYVLDFLNVVLIITPLILIIMCYL